MPDWLWNKNPMNKLPSTGITKADQIEWFKGKKMIYNKITTFGRRNSKILSHIFCLPLKPLKIFFGNLINMHNLWWCFRQPNHADILDFDDFFYNSEKITQWKSGYIIFPVWNGQHVDQQSPIALSGIGSEAIYMVKSEAESTFIYTKCIFGTFPNSLQVLKPILNQPYWLKVLKR